DAASLPSAEDVPSQAFFFLLVSAGTRSASLLIGGGDHWPHLPPSLPSGVFGPAEVVAWLYYASGDVARLCCSAVNVARLCFSAVNVARLSCSAVDVARPSCSAVDVARRFCSAVGPSGLTAVPIATPTCLALLLAPPTYFTVFLAPVTCLALLLFPPNCLALLLAPPPLVASLCSSLLSGFSWTENSSGLWEGLARREPLHGGGTRKAVELCPQFSPQTPPV
ncbi:hypothetical protein QTP86_002466, partial [Hemibagrus guttatus]